MTGEDDIDPPAYRDKSELRTGSKVNVPVRVNANVLFGNAQEIIIDHGNKAYRLRITKNGKLILTV